MDPTLLAFLLSFVFTSAAIVVWSMITKSKQRPVAGDDAPRGPVTVDL